MTTPAPGPVTIDETGAPPVPPLGYVSLGTLIQIGAPAATPAAPLDIRFTLDASLVPAGADETTIASMKLGQGLVPGKAKILLKGGKSD